MFLKLWLKNHLIFKFRVATLENHMGYKIMQVLDVLSRETTLSCQKSKFTHKIRRNKELVEQPSPWQNYQIQGTKATLFKLL